MEVKIVGGEKLAELAKRCRQAGRRDLKLEMTRAVRAEAAPVLAKLKTAIRSVDMGIGSKSSGSGHTGIRERIARAVRLKLTTGRRAGLRFETIPVPGEENMPRHVDKGRWRHRVYGHNVWVNQQAEPGWWTGTVRAAVPGLRIRVLSIFERIAAKLDR